jgi:cytochrome P450
LAWLQVEHETILNQRQAGNESDGDTVTWKEYKSMTFTSQVADSLMLIHAIHFPLRHLQKKCISANHSKPLLLIYTFFLQVISETVRLANIAPGIFRKTLKDVQFRGEVVLTAQDRYIMHYVYKPKHFIPMLRSKSCILPNKK